MYFKKKKLDNSQVVSVECGEWKDNNVLGTYIEVEGGSWGIPIWNLEKMKTIHVLQKIQMKYQILKNFHLSFLQNSRMGLGRFWVK